MRTLNFTFYKPRTKEALDSYMEKIYPRHLNSFPLLGIEAHGIWTAKGGCQATALRTGLLCGRRRPREVARRYTQSTEFADDIRSFYVSDIIGVESTIHIPTTSSPLK